MAVTSYLDTVFDVTREYATAFLLTALLAVVVLTIARPRSGGAVTLPHIHDPIPFVFNTIQFVFNNDRFMKRARYVAILNHDSGTSSI